MSGLARPPAARLRDSIGARQPRLVRTNVSLRLHKLGPEQEIVVDGEHDVHHIQGASCGRHEASDSYVKHTQNSPETAKVARGRIIQLMSSAVSPSLTLLSGSPIISREAERLIDAFLICPVGLSVLLQRLLLDSPLLHIFVQITKGELILQGYIRFKIAEQDAHNFAFVNAYEGAYNLKGYVACNYLGRRSTWLACNPWVRRYVLHCRRLWRG